MIIESSQLTDIRTLHKEKTIVFCSGVFDLLHFGHVVFLSGCKKQGDYLVVAIGNDITVRQYKGSNRPIWNESIRLQMVNALKVVDYTVLYQTTQNHPLVLDEQLLQDLQPDVYAIGWDTFHRELRQELAHKYHMKLVLIEERVVDLSTSGAINTIRNRYDKIMDQRKTTNS